VVTEGEHVEEDIQTGADVEVEKDESAIISEGPTQGEDDQSNDPIKDPCNSTKSSG
jgi:hypothetical protein